MTYLKEEILNKTGNLLLEINEEYASFAQGFSKVDVVKLKMIRAKVKYFESLLEVLENFSTEDDSSANSNVSVSGENGREEIVFTPSSGIASEPISEDGELSEERRSEQVVPRSEDEGADEQSINSEDAEVEDDQEDEVVDDKSEKLEDASDDESKNADQDLTIDDVEEEPDDEQQENDDVTETYDSGDSDQSESSGYDEDFEKIEDNVEPEQGRDPEVSVSELEEVDTNDNIVSNTKLDESEQAQVSTAHEVEDKPEETSAGELIVNQVIEQERNVFIEEKVEVTSEQAEESDLKPTRPLTLNELIQQQKKSGMTHANHFSTTPAKSGKILDLKTAVSLNDKLLFIKDLFNGYSLAYTEAVEILNRFDNFAEADAFLQANYAMKNNWNSKPQTVEKLYDILNSKYN